MTAIPAEERAAGLARVEHLRARLAARDLTGPCTVPFCPNLDVTDCAEHGCQHPPGGAL